MMGFGYGGMGYGGSGLGIFGLVIPVIMIAAVVWLVVYLVKYFTKRDEFGSKNNSAQELLAQRFARGEISEEEYKRMRDML